MQAGSARPRPAATEAAPRSSSKAKLSYKEQRELDALPGQIEALEAEQKLIADTMAGSEIYGDRSGVQNLLLNQPSLVAAGWVRLTIKPACRYRPLSMRMARSRSKPGQLEMSRKVLV